MTRLRLGGSTGVAVTESEAEVMKWGIDNFVIFLLAHQPRFLYHNIIFTQYI